MYAPSQMTVFFPQEQSPPILSYFSILRSTLGIIGSIFAIIVGVIFIIERMKFSNFKGFLIGALVILAGIAGIIICIALLKKTRH